MFDFTFNAWTVLFVLAALTLSFALAKNITTGKALRDALGVEWKKKLAEWKDKN